MKTKCHQCERKGKKNSTNNEGSHKCMVKNYVWFIFEWIELGSY